MGLQPLAPIFKLGLSCPQNNHRRRSCSRLTLPHDLLKSAGSYPDVACVNKLKK
jgi:hypothetical protein